jgi:hypothetical protein
MAQQTSVEWLAERLTLSLGDEIKYLRGFFVIANEMYNKELGNAYKQGWEDATTEAIKEVHKYQ